MHTVLIVDDERNLLEVLSVALENMGHAVLTADSAERGLAILADQEVHLVLSDLRLPGLSGRELLDEVKRTRPPVPVIIMTAYSSVKDAVELIKAGAFDYIVKPFDLHALEAVVTGALRFFHMGNDNHALRQALGKEFSGDQLIGNSPAMQSLRQNIADVSASSSNVLIMGESGTGKELVAKAIHYGGARAHAPLVIVNCAAIPEALLESEFFGHARGAFTGAVSNRSGRFVQAHGGTLFLDEIGEMPLFLQAKILRVIQDKTVEPVGATAARQVDVRIIAATNRNLPEAVEEGAFRQDLYYRLHVYPLIIPPLRERREDIPLLAAHFAARIAAKMGGSPLRFAPEAMALLQEYPWPGNVRELENYIERLGIVSPGGAIGREFLLSLTLMDLKTGSGAYAAGQLPAREDCSPASEAGEAASEAARPGAASSLDLQHELEEFERRLILDALEKSGGVQVKAAEMLGISERSIWHRVKKLGIRIKKEAS